MECSNNGGKTVTSSNERPAIDLKVIIEKLLMEKIKQEGKKI